MTNPLVKSNYEKCQNFDIKSWMWKCKNYAWKIHYNEIKVFTMKKRLLTFFIIMT